MLSISFLSDDGKENRSIRVIDDFYEWLARSEFSTSVRSQVTRIELEGEMACRWWRWWLRRDRG